MAKYVLPDERLSSSRIEAALSQTGEPRQTVLPRVRKITLGVIVAWWVFVIVVGLLVSQRIVNSWLDRAESTAKYEAETTARVVDRLFAEMLSVANMVANQSQVAELARRYLTDPPGFAEISRQERAAYFSKDTLARKVGDYMNALSSDLRYGRIYMNNMSDDTIASSNWAEPDSIVGMIYTRRAYLMDAMREGTGNSFGIARLLKFPSYFVASRIEDKDGTPLGSVTIRFDAPDMAHYLTGLNTALIVNRQGRVITTSDEAFMLRNVAVLLPPETLGPSKDEEGPGEPMEIRAMTEEGRAHQWFIEGKPYLVQRQPLENQQYQLLTLASLDELIPMRRQHMWVAAIIAILGVAFILLGGYAAGHMLMRRQDERYAANYDILTGLPNRRSVQTELKRLFAIAGRSRQWVLVAFIDLDGFKKINDGYGHEVGDKFLKEISRRMLAGLRAGDILGRFGGDEFVLIGLVKPVAPGQEKHMSEAIRNRLSPLMIGTYDFGECRFEYEGASFGIVCANPASSSPQSVLNDADQCMYADKEARRALRR